MARKPNYDFERRERERSKAEKAAQRAEKKAKSVEPEDKVEVEGTPGALPNDLKAP